MQQVRILIEVTAGMIPGKSEGRFSRQWVITSEESRKTDGFQIMFDKLALANAYALGLEIDSASGKAPNWVRTEFIWL